MFKVCGVPLDFLWKLVDTTWGKFCVATTSQGFGLFNPQFVPVMPRVFTSTLPQAKPSNLKKLSSTYTRNPQHLQLIITKEK